MKAAAARDNSKNATTTAKTTSTASKKTTTAKATTTEKPMKQMTATMTLTNIHINAFRPKKTSPTEYQVRCHSSNKQNDSQSYMCVQGASAKTWRYIKTIIEQSQHLESDILYSYFNDICLLTKTKLQTETF